LALAKVAILCEATSRADHAQSLAEQLNLPVVPVSSQKFDYLLCITLHRLELRKPGKPMQGPVFADFVTGSSGYRIAHTAHHRQPLARAVGLVKGAVTRVIDATAGLGRDGLVLAKLGCQVHMLERSAIVAALLRDGLERAKCVPNLAALIQARIRLKQVDAIPYLERLSTEARPDTIYLDPMYPHRPGSALVKKEMRVLRDINGEDQDAEALLRAALVQAKRRVVVKRPRLAQTLGSSPPSMSIAGKITRYDIYLTSTWKSTGARGTSASETLVSPGSSRIVREGQAWPLEAG
jgi:16S rRNA (guanine1516-N2)-methyltransferase